MNTPNPLMPQGSLQQQTSQGKSTVRIIFAIVAVHAVFFSGLLMSQGCKRDADKSADKKTEPSNNLANDIPPIDTKYYQNFREVPDPTTNVPPARDLVSTQTNPPAAPSTPSVPAREAVSELKEYTIAKNDNLYNIAKTHGVTVGAIVKANPGLDPAKLRPNQKIQIPASTSSPAASTGIGLTEPSSATDSGAGTTHVVKAGENLIKIAKKYNTTPKAIRTANNLKTDQLLVGKKLKIPAPAASSASNATKSASGAPLSTDSNRVAPLRASSTTTTNLR